MHPTETQHDLGFIITTSPDRGVLAQEVFDLVVSGGVFDQSIIVIFDQAGLEQLVERPPLDGQKSLYKLWQSASLFGIDRLLAEQSLVDSCNHTQAPNLFSQVEFLDAAHIQSLLAATRKVMVL